MKLKEYIVENTVFTQAQMKSVYGGIDSPEKTYQKKELTFSVKTVTEKENVVTKIDGKVKTKNIANKGDYILTGTKGEKYVLTPKKFNERYISKGEGKAVSKPVKTKAKIAIGPLTFMASWGEKMIAEKGDAIVNNKGEFYRIEKGAFNNTYEKV